MKLEINLNLNDYVTVELTEYGEKVLIDYVGTIEVLDLTDKYHKVLSYKLLGLDNIKRYQFQLWELMHIFGKEMLMGNPNQFISKNTLKIEREF